LIGRIGTKVVMLVVAVIIELVAVLLVPLAVLNA
jgi:hypothetical protein